MDVSGVLEEVLLTLLDAALLGLDEHLLLDTRDVDGADVDLGGGGDDKAGGNAAERDAVEAEGAGDEEEPALEVLEENDALASEAAGKDDEDSPGLERRTELGGDLLGDLLLLVAALAALLGAKSNLHVEAGLTLLGRLLFCRLHSKEKNVLKKKGSGLFERLVCVCMCFYSLLGLHELVDRTSPVESRARVALEVLSESKVDDHLCF